MPNEPELLAYAAKMNIKSRQDLPCQTWFSAVEKFFNDLTSSLVKPNATIGHIKGFLDLDGDSYAYFSNVGNKQGTHLDKQEGKSSSNGVLDFNVLLYGWLEEEIKIKIEQFMKLLAETLNADCNIENLSK